MSSSLHLLNVGQNKILNTTWTPGQQQQVGDIQSRLQLQLNRHRTLLFPLFLASLFQVKVKSTLQRTCGRNQNRMGVSQRRTGQLSHHLHHKKGSNWCCCCSSSFDPHKTEERYLFEDQAAANHFHTVFHRANMAYEKKLWNGSYFNYDSASSSKSNSIQADQMAGQCYARPQMRHYYSLMRFGGVTYALSAAMIYEGMHETFQTANGVLLVS
ncbi:unnamed protein product [Sphagnum compactum]